VASLDTLIARLGVSFSNQRLLRSALVHRSFLHEHPEQAIELASNERLEFLGDAIINYTAATLVFERFPERGEGDLTLLRAALINTSTLAGFARMFDLGIYIRMSRGDEAGNGRQRDALLADTFEAVVAAIGLDSGLAAAQAFLMPLFERSWRTSRHMASRSTIRAACNSASRPIAISRRATIPFRSAARSTGVSS